MLEAQVLQKRRRRKPRRAWARSSRRSQCARGAAPATRVLVLDKRLPEARKQFEAVANANPQNPDVIYAVGLLAFQLKDYKAAGAT